MLELRNRLSPQQKKFIKNVRNRLVELVPYRFSLETLAAVYETDKLFNRYTVYYEKYFEPLRHKRLNVLEIGIGGSKDDPCSGGASLRMWRQYFRKSTIYGIDIVDKRCLEEKRIKVFQGDQNDPEFLQRSAAQIGKIDVIIDDGSHISAHVITSFINLFPYLDDAGIYAIEDLATAYWPLYGGNWQNSDAPGTSMSMLKGLADGLNYKVIPHRVIQAFDQQIVALHFYPKIAFVIKGHNDYPLSGIDYKMLGGEQ